MRVLMITVRSDHGGGPRHMELLIKHLPGEIEVHVASPNDPPYGERLRYLAAGRAHTLPHRRFDLRAATSLCRYVREKKIDIVHTHGKGAGVYGRLVTLLSGIPCVHTAHGVHVGTYGATALRLYRAYENLSSRWVNHLVYVSEDERAAAASQRLWQNVPASVIPNGVEDLDAGVCTGLRAEARRKLRIPDGRLLVATLSRFDYQKNMGEAYALAKRHPELSFIWIGDGQDRAELCERSRVDGLTNVLFQGSVDDPSSLLAASDIYLSTSRWEGMPLAVLEAMAAGLPILATDVPGHSGLVGSAGFGLLYPLGCIDEASATLQRLAKESGLRVELGARARKVQEALYSCQRQVAAVAALYAKVLNVKEGV